jgi:UDP-galactopyranose mutase
VHPSGIRVHTYGPHYFRTDSQRIWSFVQRFGEWYPFHAAVQSQVDGKLEPWPVTGECVRRLCGENWAPAEPNRAPANFEEAALAIMPRRIYEDFVRGYTEKQWGVACTQLAPSLCGRFDVRTDNYLHLSRHEHQALPVLGYTHLVEQMLRGIPTVLNCDYLAEAPVVTPRYGVIFTGAIDEYYGFRRGRLAYRAQQRQTDWYPTLKNFQDGLQINYPSLEQIFLRSVEWKFAMASVYASKIRGTVVTVETPYTPVDPDAYEYPSQDLSQRALYQEYRRDAMQEERLIICGRLGEYRYWDMDQAIGRALAIADRAIEAGTKRVAG